MMRQNNDKLIIRAAFHSLADELGQLVLREHQILQDEMNQVRTLVSDAVKNLDNNFRQMSIKTSEHLRFLKRALKDVALDEKQLEKISEIQNQINLHTASTIRVLQFDDIVQQLAGHTSTRIERMQELFIRLGESLSNISLIGETDADEVQQYIESMQKEVKDFCRLLEKENPVKQNSLEEGKIELF